MKEKIQKEREKNGIKKELLFKENKNKKIIMKLKRKMKV